MENHGFIRVAVAIPEVRVADCAFNVEHITGLVSKACSEGVRALCFPELSLTAYTCADLFLQKNLTLSAAQSLVQLLEDTREMPVCFIVGAPVEHKSKLYNCAVVCFQGQILGIVPKVFLPNYAEFYEKRWFEAYSLQTPVTEIQYAGQQTPFGTNILFELTDALTFAIEICEDVWSVVPPSSYHAMAGANLIFNLSASDELIGKQHYVKSLLSQQSARCQAAYVYAAAGFGESSTDLVYAGNAYVYENGKLLAHAQRFQYAEQLIFSEIDVELLTAERKKNTTFISRPVADNYRIVTISGRGLRVNNRLSRFINPTPFIPSTDQYNAGCEEIFSIQVAGLAKRLMHTHCTHLIIGVSGGLDSTLALLVCAKTVDKLGLPRQTICGVTMPGFGTTDRTRTNAVQLMQSLGIQIKEISIVAACEQHFKDIGHDPKIHNITYENTQARERTQILMDLSNQMNGLVVGTGDLSELALGWATYNGDHISMYGVNSGIPKTLVRHLVRWAAETQMDESSKATLQDIINTPVSPELLPKSADGSMTQFTEDVVGPYELHDFSLFYTLRYGFTPEKIFFLAQHAFKGKFDDATIQKWMQVFYTRFFSQQFKRSCLPDGPKVGSVNLSPRGDWRMPSDASVAGWRIL
ncbi:NAD(+) synthase [Candidatus Symbiothrix dinenymphae]|uniref:NAD(+) synthase n=1 Tax=Candidatus Symbiothrix dinenymphae TaxID=467085 RepID=UPI0006C1D8F1|nr:NAD(+) synthase [Candidatus Symbiothrix dinenymphae]GAP73394.1 NAD synthetase [Candidatus Symbiothrix dinenymphae]